MTGAVAVDEATVQLPPRGQRFAVIGVLYLVTDIAFSFFLGAVTTILLGAGVSPQTVGLITLVGGVYLLRFLIGPVVDRVGFGRLGHYRGWILATQAASVLVLVALALADPLRALGPLIALVAVVLVLSAFHDAAVNGLMVRLLPPADRGVGNGIQVGAATASAIVGTGGALLLYSAAGWVVTVLCLAGIFLIPFAVMLRFREPVAAARPARIDWRAIGTFVASPARRSFLFAVIPALCLGPYLVTAIQSALLLDAGWDLAHIGLLLGTVAPLAAVVAGLVAGAAIARWGRVLPLAVIGAAYAAGIVALLPVASGIGWDVLTVTALLALQAVFTAAGVWVYTIATDNARPASAATDFSLQVSALGVLRVGLNAVGLGLVPVVGFPVLIAAAAVLTVAGVVWALGWARRNRVPPGD